jgi:hypothetical protein
MKYISKGEWFDEGCECILIDDYRVDNVVLNSGLFEGIRTCKNSFAESHLLGTKYRDEEICSFDEFIIIDED